MDICTCTRLSTGFSRLAYTEPLADEHRCRVPRPSEGLVCRTASGRGGRILAGPFGDLDVALAEDP